MSELNEIRSSSSFFGDLSKVVTEVGQRIDSEWVVMEKNLIAWDKNWRRIERDFTELVNLADKAQIYEKSVRSAVSGFKTWMAEFDGSIDDLHKGRELVKVHALNLNLVDDKDIEEFKQKARMLSSSINTFYESTASMREQVGLLLEKHPAASEFKSLEDQNRVYSLLQDMHKEFDDFASGIRAWKSSNGKLIEIGKRATEVLKTIETKEDNLDQLYNACRSINEKAQESLIRWG